MTDIIYNKEAYCGSCSGSKSVPIFEFLFKHPYKIFETIYTCKNKACPTCDGSGMSFKARQWRKEHGFLRSK